jgi:hypothetical protein
MVSRMRTSIYWEEVDLEALRVIREAHGLATNTAAARFAIRQVAREISEQEAWREADKRRGAGTFEAPQRSHPSRKRKDSTPN